MLDVLCRTTRRVKKVMMMTMARGMRVLMSLSLEWS
jgi:hypothetical protein